MTATMSSIPILDPKLVVIEKSPSTEVRLNEAGRKAYEALRVCDSVTVPRDVASNMAAWMCVNDADTVRVSKNGKLSELFSMAGYGWCCNNNFDARDAFVTNPTTHLPNSEKDFLRISAEEEAYAYVFCLEGDDNILIRKEQAYVPSRDPVQRTVY